MGMALVAGPAVAPNGGAVPRRLPDSPPVAGPQGGRSVGGARWRDWESGEELHSMAHPPPPLFAAGGQRVLHQQQQQQQQQQQVPQQQRAVSQDPAENAFWQRSLVRIGRQNRMFKIMFLESTILSLQFQRNYRQIFAFIFIQETPSLDQPVPAGAAQIEISRARHFALHGAAHRPGPGSDSGSSGNSSADSIDSSSSSNRPTNGGAAGPPRVVPPSFGLDIEAGAAGAQPRPVNFPPVPATSATASGGAPAPNLSPSISLAPSINHQQQM